MTQHLPNEQLIQLLPDPLLIVDGDQRIAEANAAFLHWVGMERETVIGADVATVLPALSEVLSDLPQNPSIYTERDIAGRYMVVRGALLQADDGGTPCCLLTFHDETTRKHVETALSVNEQRYRALFENSNDVVLVLDQDMIVQLANRRAASLLGVEQAKLLQKTFHRYLPEAEHATFRERIQTLLEGNDVPIYETFLQDHEQNRIPVEIDMTLVQNQQQMPTELQLIVRDIRQRQLVQSTLETRLERFSLLHAVDAEVNHTLEPDGVMAIALRASVEIAGADAGCIALAEDGAIIIRHVMGSYPETSLGMPIPPEIAHVQEAIQQKRAQYYPEAMQHPDLPDVQAAMIFPLLAYDRFIGMMFLGANDSAQFSEDNFEFIQLIATRLAVALENARLHENIRNQVTELERLNTELRNTERLKTDMLRIANHDLKNPLGIVRGYVSIFEVDQANFPPEYTEFIESMRNSLDRMETIMDDFLTVEAFKVRAAMAEMATVDLVPLVQRAVKEYSEQARDNQQSLTLVLPDDAKLFVVGDEPQLYEAAANLIGNALKYTPEGGTIHVSLYEEAGDVIFKVEDNGYGIPEERQTNLFSPFFRSRTQETVNIEGTGLGLHLVKNIIERHNGEIVFHSVYHEGSTFGFRLKHVDEVA